MTVTRNLEPRTKRGLVRAVRLAGFRISAALIALMMLVGFGAWRSVLAPWVVFDDMTDHGWARTPELHRIADGAAGLVFTALAIGAIVLVVRPLGRSGLAAWAGCGVATTGAFSWVSALLQGHDGVGAMAVFSLVWVSLTVAIFGCLHPEGRTILRGGARGDNTDRPSGVVRAALVTIGVAAVGLGVGSIIWRVSGGVFESTQEDDVVGLGILGLVWLVGSLLALRGRAGWRALSTIVIAGAAYAVVGALCVAVAG